MKRASNPVFTFLVAISCILAIIGGYYYFSQTSGSQHKNKDILTQVDEYLSQATANISIDSEKTESSLEKAKELVKINKLYEANAAIYKIEGQIALEKTDYPEALEYFISAENIYREKSQLSHPEKSGYAEILNNIGQVYFLIDRNDMALEYLNKSLNIYESLNDNANVNKSYRNLGSIYFKQGDFEKALEAYEYSLNSDSLTITGEDYAVLYSNLAAVNFSLKNVEESKKYLDKAEIEIRNLIDKDNKNTKWPKLLSNILFNKAIYFNEIGDLDLYKQYLNKAVNVLDGIYAPAEVYPALQKLQLVYESEKNIDDAYINLKKTQEVKDSLFNIENARQIANLEIQQKLFDEQQQHEIQKREMERRYWMVLAGLLLILLAFLIFLNIQKNKIINTEKEKQLLAENKQLLENKIYSQEEILNKKEHKVQDLSLKIEEKEQSILSLEDHIQQINSTLRKHINSSKVTNLLNPQNPSSDKEEERNKLLLSLEQISIPLTEELESRFGDLTERQKLLAALIKNDFTAKEIAILFNISHKSVQTAKYRLKKTFRLKPEQQLERFLKEL